MWWVEAQPGVGGSHLQHAISPARMYGHCLDAHDSAFGETFVGVTTTRVLGGLSGTEGFSSGRVVLPVCDGLRLRDFPRYPRYPRCPCVVIIRRLGRSSKSGAQGRPLVSKSGSGGWGVGWEAMGFFVEGHKLLGWRSVPDRLVFYPSPRKFLGSRCSPSARPIRRARVARGYFWVLPHPLTP